VRRAVAGVAAALLLTGCTGTAGEDTGGVAPAAGSGAARPSGTVTVFAAASLTDVFSVLGDRLEEENPELEVRFNFAGSSALATQLAQGAPADVFASADEVQMARVADEGLVEDPEVFARNPLMLVVPRDNPAGIERPGTSGGDLLRLSELLTEDVTMAVCAPEVPCGAAAAEVLDLAGLADVPDTYEDDVRAVLTKVELGEVDAGLVYLSDVHAAGDSVFAHAFREAPQAINRYPVGVLSSAPNPEAAQAFVDLVLSDAGARVLRDAGFLEP
jgi:molybdate transport system substrate-binding protein